MLHNTKTDDENAMKNAKAINVVLWMIWGWHLVLALVIYAVAEGIN